MVQPITKLPDQTRSPLSAWWKRQRNFYYCYYCATGLFVCVSLRCAVAASLLVVLQEVMTIFSRLLIFLSLTEMAAFTPSVFIDDSFNCTREGRQRRGGGSTRSGNSGARAGGAVVVVEGQ